MSDRVWAEKGDKSQDEIFAAVGRALSHWEMVESSIASLFTIITVGDYHAPTNPMLRAYAAIVGSGSRINMVRAALKSWMLIKPDCPLSGNAVELLNQCSNWASRRNDIAHGLADMFFEERGWFLVPSLYTLKGRTLKLNSVAGRAPTNKPDYRYNSEIINKFSDDFLALYNSMNETTSAIGEWQRINNSVSK